jgi:transposase
MIAATIKENIYAELSRKELIEELYRQKTQIVLQANEIAGLKDQLTELKRLVFGSKHERFAPSQNSDQLFLGLEAQQQDGGERKTETIQYTRTKSQDKKQPQRLPLPSHLPRERIVIEPNEDVSALKSIGEEITEELEYVPGKLFVRQYVRPKYAKANGEGIITAELPLRPIEKGIAGPGLLAQTIIDKYCDHLPVYRQIERFKREGITLSSSTVGEWIAGTCALLSPLYDALKKEMLSSDYLQADETPIKVLDKDKKGTTHRGFHWVYHAPAKRLVLFDYREGRGRDGPRELLRDFKGYLQTDGYGVYDEFDGRNGITLVNCFAHARRKFDKALENDKDLASEALSMIQQIYALEREIREEKRDCMSVRKEKSAPALEALWNWMEATRHKVLPKSLIGEAIHYALYRKKQLSLFLADEKLYIDNNLIENAIRPVAIGRKNYLFAGSHEGARRAAMLYSLLGTCKMHGVNPFQWLRDILSRIPAHHASKLYQLLPHNWNASSAKD